MEIREWEVLCADGTWMLVTDRDGKKYHIDEHKRAGISPPVFRPLYAAPVPSHEHPIRDRGEGAAAKVSAISGGGYAVSIDVPIAEKARVKQIAAEMAEALRLYAGPATLPPARVEEGPRVKPLEWLEGKKRDFTALERERDEARQSGRDARIEAGRLKACMDEQDTVIRELKAENEAFEAEVERLKEALKPFDGLATVVLGEAPADAEFIIVHTDSITFYGHSTKCCPAVPSKRTYRAL